MQPDMVSRESGITTFVDAGSAGASNFLGFKEYVIDQSRARIFSFLNIAYTGTGGAMYDPANYVIVGETEDIRHAMVGRAIEYGEAFPSIIKGIKVRVSLEASGSQGLTPLLLALQAAEALEKPVMVHICVAPPTRQQVLSVLRKGDILTHAFRESPNSPLDAKGKVIPEMLEARERGVVIDLGHGGGSFSWDVCKELLEQGYPPDVISSDIHLDGKVRTSWPGSPAFNQPTTMSKLLSLGISLEDVILRSTYNPAKAIGEEDELGSLQVGSVADIAVFQLEEGQFEFEDPFCGTRVGNKRLKPVLTIVRGEVMENAQDGT